VRLTPREKTGFEVKETDEDRLRERMVERTAGGSLFHVEEPTEAKDLD